MKIGVLCLWARVVDALFTAAFVLRGLQQILVSLVLAPFRVVVDVPEVTSVDTDRNRYLLERMPSVREFRPWRLAVGPVAQTLAAVWGAKFRNHQFMSRNQQRYTRELLAMPDGVAVALDWKAKPDLPDSTPLIFVAHGLGGDSGSHYARVLTDCLCDKNYRSVVYNRRGHHGTRLLPSRGLEPGHQGKVFPQHWDEEDMSEVVEHVCRRYPAARKFAIGFSCGANVIANFQALRGESSPFLAAASLGNGYDLVTGTKYLAGQYIADGLVASFLKSKLYEGHPHPNLKDAALLAEQQNVDIDWMKIMCSTSLRAFEKALLVPAYGYRDEDDYYHENTCHWRLKDVKKPLLCIANWDDPPRGFQAASLCSQGLKREPQHHCSRHPARRPHRLARFWSRWGPTTLVDQGLPRVHRRRPGFGIKTGVESRVESGAANVTSFSAASTSLVALRTPSYFSATSFTAVI
jgi:predicted alpha/beta-fold hydrolase